MAAPAYNQYKKGSTKTALQSELSNLVKAYNAKNAVDASYCHTFPNVGFTQDGTTPLYAKKAFLGFEQGADTADHNCGTSLDITKISIKTDVETAGHCMNSGFNKKTPCETNMAGDWVANAQQVYNASPDDCELGEGAFYAGATTAVSALNVFYTTNEDGMITEQPGDPNTLNCADVGGKYANVTSDLPGDL